MILPSFLCVSVLISLFTVRSARSFTSCWSFSLFSIFYWSPAKWYLPIQLSVSIQTSWCIHPLFSHQKATSSSALSVVSDILMSIPPYDLLFIRCSRSSAFSFQTFSYVQELKPSSHLDSFRNSEKILAGFEDQPGADFIPCEQHGSADRAHC